MSGTGIILKLLSGFYYVYDGHETITCRARGKFRYQKLTPLVGDRVRYAALQDGSGIVEEILPRKMNFTDRLWQISIRSLWSRQAPLPSQILSDRPHGFHCGEQGM
jgi:putative ribosome biogenesis GTPase RsgA